MLDIHTHILPGVDDGSRSVEESLLMLQAEAAQGVDAVVLTPHYDAGRESPEAFAKRRAAAGDALLSVYYEQAYQQPMPELHFGAEVAFFDGLSRVEALEALCIDGAPVMLVEMPFCPWTQRMLHELEELQQVRGVTPILAHIERYRSFQPKSLWQELHESGFWLQCNTSFFLKWQTRPLAMKMLKQRLIQFVATDCHGLEYRPPDLGSAMEKIRKRGGDAAFKSLRAGEEALWERML